MGKDFGGIFMGTDNCFEPCKAQKDPLDVLRERTINNMHAFLLLTLSQMLKDGEVRLEASKKSPTSEALAASLTQSLPATLESIAKEILKK